MQHYKHLNNSLDFAHFSLAIRCKRTTTPRCTSIAMAANIEHRQHQRLLPFSLSFMLLALGLTAITATTLQSDIAIAQNYSRVTRHNHRPAASSRTEDFTTTCGGIYRSANTVLKSPHYPANYPRNLHCTYELRSPVHCTVDFHVHFVDFNLQTTSGIVDTTDTASSSSSSTSCAHDRLHIADAEVLCGRVIGRRTYRTSDDGVLHIMLHIDDDAAESVQSGGGFELHVQRSPCIGGGSRRVKSGERERRVLRMKDNASGDDVDGDTAAVTAVYPIYERPPPTAGGTSIAGKTANPTTSTSDRQYLPSASFYPAPVDPYNAISPGSCWNTPAFPAQPGLPEFPQYPAYNPGTWQNTGGVSFTPNTQTPPPYNTPYNPLYPTFPSYYPSTNQPPNIPNQPSTPGNTQQCIPYCLPAAMPTPNTPVPPSTQQPLPPIISSHHFPTVQPIENQAQIYPPTLPNCCSRRLNQRHFYLTSNTFPTPRSSAGPNIATPPPLHAGQTDCVYHIERAHPSICRLRIQFRFFAVGAFDSLLGCQHAYVDIDGQRLCGCNTGLRYVAQWGVGAKVICVRQWSADSLRVPSSATTVRGFWLDVVQEECPYRIRASGSSQHQHQRQPPIIRRSDDAQQSLLPRLHSTVTQTNRTSTITHVFYDTNAGRFNISASDDDPLSSSLLSLLSKAGDTKTTRGETKEEFDRRTEEPTSAQFFFIESLVPTRDRCTFSYAQYLRLAIDPLWQLRPRCDI